MRRQLVPGPVVRLTVIKAKTRPGIEAMVDYAEIFPIITYNYNPIILFFYLVYMHAAYYSSNRMLSYYSL